MRGYTLLEIVVYIAILAIIVVLSLGSILSTYNAFGRIKIERKLVTNGEVAMERLVREIRAATSTKPSSVFSVHPGNLVLNTGESFALSDGILQIQEGAGPAQNLTSSDVSITKLIFYATSTAVSKMINIEITIEGGVGKLLRNKTFYGGAVMRGAY
jgi:type II secretory pathway pseudopilin PulG